MNRLILASASPRRKQLLEWAEIEFRVVVSDAAETYPAGLPPAQIAQHIALKKAMAVKAVAEDDSVILAADTIVVLGDEIIGKPADRADAVAILSKLSGQTHSVITGVVLMQGDKTVSFADITGVSFHNLSPQQIGFYVDKYQPYDKAGAYAIQEWIGVTGIKSINGDFYNVMGLPVSRVVQALRDL
jgi:septum formation protein